MPKRTGDGYLTLADAESSCESESSSARTSTADILSNIISSMEQKGILVVTPADTIQLMNDRLLELLNLSPDFLKVGDPRRKLVEFRAKRGDFGDDPTQRINEEMSEFAPGRTSTKEIKVPSGKVIQTVAQPLLNGGSVITYAEVTELRTQMSEIEAQQLILDFRQEKLGQLARELEMANFQKQALLSKFQAVIDNINYGVVFLDKSLRADIVNQAFRDLWNHAEDYDTYRKTMRELMEYNRYNNIYDIDDSEWEDYADARVAAVKNGSVPPTLVYRKDGRIISYQCVALPDGYRMLTYFDVTEIKKKDEQTRRNAEAIEVILNNIDHGLTWFDENLKLRAWNAKFRELLDFPKERFDIGDHLSSFFRFNAERGEYGEGNTDAQVDERIEIAKKFEPHKFERERNDGTILRIEGFPVSEGGFVTVYTDVTEERRTQARIQHLSKYDTLTGLPNRVLFHDRLEQAHVRTQAGGETSAIMSLDVDHFKDINDSLGHSIGDKLLNQVVSRIEGQVSETDIFSRLGGDEFAVIQSDIRDPNDAAELAQRIVNAVSKPYRIDNHYIVITISVGIALCSPDDPNNNPDQLLRSADMALHWAKEEGRGVYYFFQEEMNIQLQARKSLERDIRLALAEGQFEVHYQPQICAADGQTIVGVEALLRWNHPSRGAISPAEFISLTEKIGLISPISEFVLRTACSAAKSWGIKLAVNLSPILFRKPGVFEMVSSILKVTNFQPERLEIEITEGALLGDTETTLSTLSKLKSLGVSIAMDDFGTGYSSLSYLRRFPFDKLKIDRNFIQDIGQNEEANAIVHAVINLGKSLGMRANAEGVETFLQADILRLEGCDELQGYFFSKPIPAEDLEQMLKKGISKKPDQAHKDAASENKSSQSEIARTG